MLRKKCVILLFLIILGIFSVSCVSAVKDPVKLDEWGELRDNHGYNIAVKLTADNGFYPIANQKIYITYKGKTYTDYTSKNGVAAQFLKIKGYGKQTIKIKFNGNKYYKAKTVTHKHYFIPTAVTSYNSHGPYGVTLELFNGQYKDFKNGKLANEFIKKNNKKYAKEIKFNKKHNSYE